MPLYDDDTFESSLLPGTIKKDLRETIETAVILGWKVHITGRQSFSVIPPVEGQCRPFHFGVSTGKSTNIQTMRRKVIKYADPVKLAYMVEASRLPKSLVSYVEPLPMLGDAGTVITHPEEEPQPTARARRRAEKEQRETARQQKREAETVPEAAEKQADVEVEPDPGPPTIVSERPMLAKSTSGKESGAKGRGYTSPTTIERLWSDGTKDYMCAFKGCTSGKDGGPVVSTNRLTPSRHYGNVHSGGHRDNLPKDKRKTFVTDVPDAAHYRPQRLRVAALAAVIKAMMDEGNTDPTDIARTSLTWVHEQTRDATGLAGEREEMTDEQLVHRMRLLLDDGSYFAVQEELRERDALVATLTSEKRIAEHRAEVAMDNWRSLRDIVTGIDMEDEGDDKTESEASTG